MKKIILSLVLSFGFLAGLFAQVINTEDAFYIYLKGNGYALSEDDYLQYAEFVETDVYNKYHNDEFEWEDQFTKLKNNFDKRIKDAELDNEYTIATKIDFGKYDSEKGGYIVEIADSTFFPLDQMNWKASRKTLFGKQLALKLDSLSSYNLIPMDKEDAKKLLDSRKLSSGKVDRSVMILIKYKFADFNSKEYKNFEKLALDNSYLPLVGIVSEIEVYDTSKGNQKKIGNLVK